MHHFPHTVHLYMYDLRCQIPLYVCSLPAIGMTPFPEGEQFQQLSRINSISNICMANKSTSTTLIKNQLTHFVSTSIHKGLYNASLRSVQFLSRMKSNDTLNLINLCTEASCQSGLLLWRWNLSNSASGLRVSVRLVAVVVFSAADAGLSLPLRTYVRRWETASRAPRPGLPLATQGPHTPRALWRSPEDHLEIF